MIRIRRARPADSMAIAQVHVASWRSTYPGLLPPAFLLDLSAPRLAGAYQRALLERRDGEAVFVATLTDEAARERIIGFASCGRARRLGLGEGEIDTLYVLEDWQEQGIGRRLMRAAAAHLTAIGCRSAMLWVLSDNPARWFYERLGGRPVARDGLRVGGQAVSQTAMGWDPIALLLEATARAHRA